MARLFNRMCFSTLGFSEHVIGVILHWETLFQKDASGKDMVDIINENGIIRASELTRRMTSKASGAHHLGDSVIPRWRHAVWTISSSEHHTKSSTGIPMTRL